MSPRFTCTRTSHTLRAQAQPRRVYAQVKLKEQAKERQQAELAEHKRVAAQQEAAWVKFEQERQAKAEVENAAKAASRAEAGAMRRLAMMSGRQPKGDGPIDSLKKLADGKGSKKQKAGAKGKGGSARSKCLRSHAVTHRRRAHPRAQGCPLGPRGGPSAFGCEGLWWGSSACLKCPIPPFLTYQASMARHPPVRRRAAPSWRRRSTGARAR